jgi:hypothetical protein
MEKTYCVTDEIRGISATGQPYTHTGQGVIAVSSLDEQEFLDFFPGGVRITVAFTPNVSGVAPSDMNPNFTIELAPDDVIVVDSSEVTPVPSPTTATLMKRAWHKLTHFLGVGQ